MPSLPDSEPVPSEAKAPCDSGPLGYDKSCPHCFARRGRLRYQHEVTDKSCSISFDVGGPNQASAGGGEKVLLVGVLATKDVIMKSEENKSSEPLERAVKGRDSFACLGLVPLELPTSDGVCLSGQGEKVHPENNE